MMRLFAITAAALAVGATAASSPPTMKSMNFSLGDLSPVLNYSPCVANPNADNTTRPECWNVTFADSPYNTWALDKVGKGASTHWTNGTGAFVELQWAGTGVYFLGDTKGNVSLQVDGDDVTFDSNATLLAGYKGLKSGWHTARLTVLGGMVILKNVTYTAEFQTYADTAAESDQTVVNAVVKPDYLNNPDIRTSVPPYGNAWDPRRNIGPTGDQMEFPRIDTNVQGAKATYIVPANTTYITLWGSMNSNHGSYTVTVDPKPPLARPGAEAHHGFAPWATGPHVLYAMPLDPTVVYTVVMENMDQGSYLDLQHISMYNITGDPSDPNAAARDSNKDAANTGGKKRINGGAIAGIVIGVLLFLGLVLAIVLFFFVRSKRRERRKLESDFDVDDSAMVTVVPNATGNSNGLTPTPYHPPYSRAPDSATTDASEYVLSPENPTESSAGVMMMKQQLLARGMGVPGESPDAVSYVTDTDAGPAREQVQLMPPSYNPEWAGSSSQGSSSEAGTTDEFLGRNPFYNANADDAKINSSSSITVDETSPNPRRGSTYKGPMPPPRN